MTTQNSDEEIGAEVLQNGQNNVGGEEEAGAKAVNDGETTNGGGGEEAAATAVNDGETTAGEVEGSKVKELKEKEGEEEKAVDNGDESVEDDRAFGTKTPPASQQRQTPPFSPNTRASTRKRRSAAPIFQSGGGRIKRTSASVTKASDISTKTSNTTFTNNIDDKSNSNNLNKHDTSSTSVDDPFNFTTQSDVHPEPLKNISIERSSFNEVKYTKSLPSSADRYANMEKIAASRNPQLAASLSTQPSNSKDSLSHLSSMTSASLRLDFGDTPKSISSISQHGTITKPKLGLSGTTRKRRSDASTAAGGTTPRSTAPSAKKPRTATRRKRSKRGRRAASDEDDDEEEIEVEEEEEAETEDDVQQQGDQNLSMEVDGEQPQQQQGSTSERRGRKRGTTPKATAASTPKTPADAGVPKTPERGSLRRTVGLDSTRKSEQKQKEELLYQVPELSPAEQLGVDCPQDAHLFMGVGARVLALWGNDYYSANICGREALGRYYVHFVEDNLNRMLPPTGVIPVSALKPGTKISFIDIVNDEEIGKVCEVVEQPPTDDAGGWARGEFKLCELDEDGNRTDVIKTVLWAKLFLNKEQGTQLLQLLKQQKTPVAGVRTAQKLNPVQDIDEENIISDARSFRRSRSAALARLSTSSTSSPFAVPPPMAAAASSDDNNTSLDTESITTTPPRTPRRGKQKQPPSTPPAKNISSNTSNGSGDGDTPVPRSALRRRGSRTSPRLAPVVEKGDKEEDIAEEEEENQQQTNEEVEQQKTEEQTDNETKMVDEAEKATTEAQKEEESEEAGGSEQKQEEEKMELDNDNAAGPGEQQQPTATNAVKPTDDEADKIAQQRPHKEDEKETSKEATSLSAVQQTVPIKRTVVTEKTIFSGLKFVLTSATRPNKKVTDFNKRDYRKKIEERGGRIIEDFTHPLASDETAYLIADTYYRTHKYLSALSLSIPCVSYKWIQQCVAEKQLTDHKPFLLPAGESSLDTKQQFEWRPLKGVLMKGKRVLIWSSSAESDPGIVSFAEIWTPILQNLGATLVGIGPGEPFASKSSANLEEKMEFCSKIEPHVDVLLAETDCQAEVAKLVEERGGLAVSSEWVIQAIVTGSLPDLGEPGGEKFRYDFV
ncbi:hypothetical protein niasHT_024566 [Heterodera trifolii]|uniref:BRCT domain-containing protein n=1 Tax=Heterodera trifolii TaxID=157864 RepID=A0ABD2K7E8_9BILA